MGIWITLSKLKMRKNMYKLSTSPVNLISKIIKDGNRQNYSISNREEMEEFCFTVAFLGSGDKNSKAEIDSMLKEIQEHISEIDYDDLKQRL